VLGERRAVRERLLAESTPVRTFPGVRPQMRRHGRALGEAAVTDRTPERLVSAVSTDVRRQVGRLRDREGVY